MILNDLLLFFTTGLGSLDDFFDFSMRMHLMFFDLFLIFLFFYDKCTCFSFKSLGHRRFGKKVLYFFLIEVILFGSSFGVELDSFLNRIGFTLY